MMILMNDLGEIDDVEEQSFNNVKQKKMY